MSWFRRRNRKRAYRRYLADTPRGEHIHLPGCPLPECQRRPAYAEKLQAKALRAASRPDEWAPGTVCMVQWCDPTVCPHRSGNVAHHCTGSPKHSGPHHCLCGSQHLTGSPKHEPECACDTCISAALTRGDVIKIHEVHAETCLCSDCTDAALARQDIERDRKLQSDTDAYLRAMTANHRERARAMFVPPAQLL